jgi:hypothetical protein
MFIMALSKQPYRSIRKTLVRFYTVWADGRRLVVMISNGCFGISKSGKFDQKIRIHSSSIK